ncbi:DUF1127 domain-containing protein [Sedimentitalea sp. HM32M-2]|uniref:DUF1127 domain-containing protein n=1 Tax=Sedimentitalea sp. HM32M-2 TaxID=3351566 RepID=UPI003628EE53
MAHLALTASHAPLSPFGWLHTAIGRLNRFRKFRQTIKELSRLEDSQLEDLGLTRAMIRRVAYQAAHGSR